MAHKKPEPWPPHGSHTALFNSAFSPSQGTEKREGKKNNKKNPNNSGFEIQEGWCGDVVEHWSAIKHVFRDPGGLVLAARSAECCQAEQHPAY